MYLRLNQARHLLEKMRLDDMAGGCSRSFVELCDNKELSDDCTIWIGGDQEAKLVKNEEGETGIINEE